MKYLAIDYGDKRTGLATCDEGEIICSPLKVVVSDGRLADNIVSVIEEYGIEGVVVGLPLNMDGTEGGQAKKVREFAEILEKQVNVPIFFQDERLSSFDADEKLAGAELTNKKKKKVQDALAAASFLQGFLDSKKD